LTHGGSARAQIDARGKCAGAPGAPCIGPEPRTARKRDKARTKLRATRLLAAAAFRSPQWHGLYAVIIQAVTGTK
jgi:hypothetical protein